MIRNERGINAMKRVSVAIMGLVVAFCMAFALAGCASSEYTPQKKEQTVSDSALKSPGVLRVGVNASNAPYSAEQSGTIVGTDVDVAAALADQMGLKLELVDVGTSVDTAFDQENVDIVMGVTASNSAYWMSESYFSSGVALFSLTQEAQAPTASGGFKVAAQASSMSSLEVENHYGSSCLESVSDPTAAFEALKTGGVNYVAADSTSGEYVVHVSDVEAYPIALLQDPSQYSIAVAKTNTALQQGVTDALSSLKNGGVIDVVFKSWLGDQVEVSSLPVVKATAKKADDDADEKTTGSDSSSTTDASDESSSASTSTDGSTSAE